MDDLTLMRLIGLGGAIVAFVVTILLMPWIFGENPPSEAADLRREGGSRSAADGVPAEQARPPADSSRAAEATPVPRPK
jgi:hypothetical protein